MSPTVHHYRIVPALAVPEYASAALACLVRATHAAIQVNVDKLGVGRPSEAPKFTKMLRDNKIVDDQNQSLTTVSHNQTASALRDLEASMETNDVGVDSSTYGAFAAADDAYVDIEAAVANLQRTIHAAQNTPGPSIDPSGRSFWPESVEGPLRTACARTTHAVEQRMRTAAFDIQRHADKIRESMPMTLAGNGYSGAPGPQSALVSRHSYVPPLDAGIVDKIKGFAENELGVTETGSNHVNRPYNIDDAWCASFATWVWKQSGINVDWSNKNYVPSLWSDAARQGLADSNVSAARPGDLVVFAGQNHLGVVVARDGNTITTVEGNSGDAVRQHTYVLTDGNFTGVIHPPSSTVRAV
ncbi:CHAP domain-containing protein [Nocardia yamanashiensis]|uniref:CHAP domain-containing protein n=1 Tax=Nocardia yamanashiensis TaxID=209247 RepID=UPI000A405D11|nr:CHAP domain-containing protein [Nocardia yamanashiensis]